jgi:hypothetical protein
MDKERSMMSAAGASTPSTTAIQDSPADALDLTVEQTDLARALRLVGRAVPTRTAHPPLQQVLLEATAARLTLTATDLALSLMTAIPARVARPGRVALPARLLADYAAQLPEGAVHLTGEPGQRRVPGQLVAVWFGDVLDVGLGHRAGVRAACAHLEQKVTEQERGEGAVDGDRAVVGEAPVEQTGQEVLDPAQ